MSKAMRETLRDMLERYMDTPPEITRENLKEKYPDITLEDARRVKEGLLAFIHSKTKQEQRQRGKEYKALHDELKKKYRSKGGKL